MLGVFSFHSMILIVLVLVSCAYAYNSPAEAVAAAAQQSAHPTLNLKGLCDHAVALWYGLDHSGQPSARQHWLNIPSSRKYPGATHFPEGALVFYGVVSSGYGHVAIADGKGFIWSTDILRAGKVDRVPWRLVYTKWGLPLLGWSDPVFPGLWSGPRLHNSTA